MGPSHLVLVVGWEYSLSLLLSFLDIPTKPCLIATRGKEAPCCFCEDSSIAISSLEVSYCINTCDHTIGRRLLPYQDDSKYTKYYAAQ